MRHHIRHSSDIPIHYDLVDFVYDQKDYLNNISVGGLCFRSKSAIDRGMTILIRIPLAHPVFQGVGVIVWCKKNTSYYDVGVQFIDEETDHRMKIVEQVCYIEKYKQEIFDREGRKLTGEEAAIEWIRKYAKEFQIQNGGTQ